jgi:delta 1-pyrroline-5-carboxylate dehydrogenase
MAPSSVLPSLAAGSWISDGDTTDDVNPSDLSDVVGQAVRVDREAVSRTVDAAREAQPAWAAA